MFEISCYNSQDDSINYFTQWDLNQTVTIVMHGCDETYLQHEPEVHFCNINSKEAIVVPAKVKEGTVDTIIADVPNILLTEHYPLLVYIYLFNETTYTGDDPEGTMNHSQRVVNLQTEIPVRRRIRPSDYNYVQNVERITASMIVEAAEKEIDAAMVEFNQMVDGVKAEIAANQKDATDAIQAKMDEFSANAETAVGDAVQEIKDTVDATYINETDIVYDLDSYSATENDGKVLSASEGAELLHMIETKADYFGLCETDASDASKQVVVSTDNFEMKNGTVLNVRFNHENTAKSPTLNVNGSGSIPIQTGGSTGAYWNTHQTVTFVYDDQADMFLDGSTSPVWQVASSPVYGNSNVIGNENDKHIELTDSEANDKMLFKYSDDVKMYLDSFGLNMGEQNKLYDEYGTLIANGVPPAMTSDDPDTTTEHLILTNHANVPMNVGTDNTHYYMYVLTFFENKDEEDAYKTQIAIPFNKIGSVYHRYYGLPYNAVIVDKIDPETREVISVPDKQWNPWRRHTNEDEISNLIANQKQLIGWSHAPGLVINGVLDSQGRTGYMALVYDSGTYYFRPNGSNEERGGVTGVPDVKMVLGSVGYPMRSVHTKFLRVYGSDDTADSGTWTATIAGSMQTQFVRPSTTNKYYLGGSSGRWAGIYSSTSVNVSSDITVKTDLSAIDDKYIELFDLVQPYSYKFIDGTSGRTHTGFISQYVEEAMQQVGLESTDLAFFCKDAVEEDVFDEEGNITGTQPVLDENGEQVYFYSLRYEEYIAIMTEKIKRMEKKHEEEIVSLQEQIDALKTIVLNLS